MIKRVMGVTEESVRAAGVRLEGVVREFKGGVRAVDGLSLEVGAGEFVGILGPSGCGKSTLLRMIAGLDGADGGKVVVGVGDDWEGGGRPSPRPSPGVPGEGEGEEGRLGGMGYVFQDAHLLPWRDVVGNVGLPLELAGVGTGERVERARVAIEEVGLGEFARRYPAELSGGMRMRVSLARALVTRPGLLLMDEPFAALDEITRQKLDEMLRGLWLRHGMTVLFVTHSIAEATFLAERAVVLTRRPARIVVDRKIELPEERGAGIRGEAGFAREMRGLYEALEVGMRR